MSSQGEATRGARHPLPSRSSANQAGEASVGEDFATGLAGGAIGHFVGLVGDAAEVVAAAGAGVPGPAVDDEPVAELGGKAAGAFAFAGQGGLEDLVHGNQ